MEELQVIIFTLEQENYGIDIEGVSGIEADHEIVRVPNSSRNIKGIINLRGEVIPVIDLKTKFNIPNNGIYEDNQVIIVNTDECKIALLVDGVKEIHSIEDKDVVEMPSVAKGEGVTYFEKVVRKDGNLVIIIRPDMLLSEDEKETARQLTDKETE